MLKKKGRDNLALILLIALSFTTHFWALGQPNEVVFDEVHFGKFASAYYTGNYYFDIHPPLGKLILAAGGRLTGFEPGFSFESIGLKYPDSKYYGLRFFPALAGSLIALAVYLIIRNLGGSKKMALLGMLFIILENSFLIQTRLILIDAFLLLFGLSGILFYLVSRNSENKRNRLINLLLSGIFLGASVSIKWTGLIFWFVVFLFSLSNLIRHCFAHSKNIVKPISLFLVFLFLVPFIFYTSIFAFHFSLLPNSGAGDAFMSQRFQSTLNNNALYNSEEKMGFFEKFFELNNVMLNANAGLTATHPYGVKWYTMPLMERSLYYWVRSEPNGSYSRIYLLGNPFVWWAVFLGIIIFSVSILRKLVKRDWKFLKSKWIPIVFLAAYFLNIATYIFISRVIFLYHYFPSLLFGIILFPFIFESKLENRRILWGIILISAAVFVFFSPLSYGWPLDKFLYEIHNWLPGWV